MYALHIRLSGFSLSSTNGSEEFSEFPRMAANKTCTVNVKSCQSIHEVRPSNLLHGEDRGVIIGRRKVIPHLPFFQGQKPRASKLSKFAERLTSFFKYPVKRLFEGCKRGNNVFLVLLLIRSPENN